MITTLTPREVARIALNVYQLEHVDVGTLYKADGALGCEGLFKVADDARFNAKTGGHLYSRLSGFGYIAEGEGAHAGEYLIAIRGTNPGSARDWLTDARAGFCRGDSGHSVHLGFQTTWKSFENDVREYFRGRNPTRIHCVGHSLGGALATLCADYLSANNVGEVSLYTFGAPRAGMREFAEALTERMGVENFFRVTNVADPVAVVPIYPFYHAPYLTRQYVVGGAGLPINPWAHPMGGYVKAVGQASWATMVDRSTTMVVADEVKRWLETVSSGGGVTRFSVETFTMIGKALGWILQQAYEGVGLGSCSLLTALDHLGYLVERGTRFTEELGADIKTTMSAILRFIGHSTVIVGEITVAFLRFVLDLFYGAIRLMAVQARAGDGAGVKPKSRRKAAPTVGWFL
ncbi:MAG: lipase family protein [Nibricoccus sp.]